jgi:DNA-binding MarR family transcriptional regulator
MPVASVNGYARRVTPAPHRADDPVDAVERAMVRIRRSQSRRALGRAAAARSGRSLDPARFAVLDAVEEGSEHEGAELGVGAVAERLGIDPSRASRLVAEAVAAGLVERVASQADGRRIRLRLTGPGADLVGEVREGRRAMFARVMADWSEDERAEFARGITRFVDGLGRETGGGAPGAGDGVR